MKATTGCGRKSSKFVEALHLNLGDEFDWLRKLGARFNGITLNYFAMDLLCSRKCGAYSYNIVDPATGVQLHGNIDQQWIQGFTDRSKIVCRSITGSRSEALIKLEDIEKHVGAHTGKSFGKLYLRLWDEDDFGNAEDTHFVINVYNGKNIGVCADKQLNYGDVVSDGESFTMMVCLSGRL